eukprot:5377743-Karenia_brevis.AAC.1
MPLRMRGLKFKSGLLMPLMPVCGRAISSATVRSQKGYLFKIRLDLVGSLKHMCHVVVGGDCCLDFVTALLGLIVP